MELLEIHTLRVFLEAARTLNFTEAGRVLGLSQPAVSMQIRSLEDHLRVKLFERSRQGLQLTRAGEKLVPRAQQIIALVIDTEEALRAVDGEIVGDVVIGSSATVGKYILPHAAAQFRQQHPTVNVTIRTGSPREMMSGVVSGDYAFALTGLAAPDYDADYREFVVDHLVLIAPAAHPWAGRGAIEARELLGEQFICREADSPCRAVVTAELGKLGVDIADLDIVMEVGSAEALALAVEQGIGISFISVLAAMPRVALGRLAIVDVEGLTLHNPTYMATAHNRASSAAAAALIAYLQQPSVRAQMQAMVEGRFA